MELKQYLKLIQKNIIFICILAALGAFLGFYSAGFLPSGYRQSQTFFVSESAKNENPESSFKQERVLNYTDSAVSIIQSEDFLLSLQVSQSKIEAKKLASQVVQLTSTNQSAEKSKQDLLIVVSKFNEKTEQLLGDKSIQLAPIGIAPEPAYFALSNKILPIFGASIGIIISAAILALVSYLKL